MLADQQQWQALGTLMSDTYVYRPKGKRTRRMCWWGQSCPMERAGMPYRAAMVALCGRARERPWLPMCRAASAFHAEEKCAHPSFCNGKVYEFYDTKSLCKGLVDAHAETISSQTLHPWHSVMACVIAPCFHMQPKVIGAHLVLCMLYEMQTSACRWDLQRTRSQSMRIWAMS